MKYFTAILGILAIAIVTIVNFYPEKVKDFYETKILKKEYIIAKANDYYLDSNFSYIKNYTDDVSNKEELIDYIYYVINTGSEYADGECTKEYKNCVNDLKYIAEDEETLSIINNFVHPYNSFKTISFTYNERGKFSLIIEHIYTKEEITEINYVVNNTINTLIRKDMTNEEKIKTIHDNIINNTEYDTLKTKNIQDNTYKSNTAYGVLIQGYGICSGYSDAMAIFLNALNIENYKISNSTHIWNLVHINGVWVHLDATWDDPISQFNANRDTYFLINYNELSKLNDGTHNFNKQIYKEAY
ncbi:MAG: transglutaminase domain-containing protein [bacterium]|nr:transglutaminase domain-containing protein [bacterium]